MPFSMLCLLLFLATATPLSLADLDLNTCECARATASDRIVGGSEVSPKYSLPYQVFFYAGGGMCGGTIINRRYVLTAAHCMYKEHKTSFGQKWYTLRSKSEFMVIAGEHDVMCDGLDNEGGQILKVERVIEYPDFDIHNNVREYDIAILKLKTDIKFGDHVKPACLPSKKLGSYDGMTAIASGWGDQEDSKDTTSCKLKRTSLKILDRGDPTCAVNHNDTTRMCAYEKDTDTCQGDSGGPLVVVQDRKYVLVGVTNYGRGCAKYPGVYARVTHYLEWIADETKDGNCQGR